MKDKNESLVLPESAEGVFPIKIGHSPKEWKADDFSHVSIHGFGKKKFPKMPEYNHDGGFVLKWGVPGFGFGEITFVNRNGELTVDTECMSKEFVAAALDRLLKTAKLK